MGLRLLTAISLLACATATLAACQWLVPLQSDGLAVADAGNADADGAADDRPRRYATLYGGPLPIACLTAPVAGPTDSITLYVGGSIDNHENGYEWRFDDIEVRSAVSEPSLGAVNARTSSASCVATDPGVVAAWPQRIWCNDFDAVPPSDAGNFGFAGALGISPGSPNVSLDSEHVYSKPSSLFFRFPALDSESTNALFQSVPGIDTSNIRLDFKFRFGAPGGRTALDHSMAFLLLGIGRDQAGIAFGAVRGELAMAFLPRVVDSKAPSIEAASVRLGDKFDPTPAFLPVTIVVTSAPPGSIACEESCLFRDAGCN